MLVVWCLIALVSAASAGLRIDPLVDTQQGLVRGLRSDNGKYSKFLGVPYALVDEDNPFGPSIPHPGFDDTFEAYDDSAVCPHLKNGVAVGALQCLNLNVYVPNTATSRNKLPVMVWIHGGGFTYGSGTNQDYSFEDLVRHDVIAVSINYRLGPYGFFCVDSPNISGNQGLKDQRMALKWVKDNIEAFGGDSSKVTVFGESAGGISVELHLLLEQEKLFNQAIVMSGSVFTTGAVMKPDNRIPIDLANRLGFETEDFLEAISFLSEQDPHLVIAAANSNIGVGYKNMALSRFAPCIEIESDGVDVFISDIPENWNPTKARSTPVIYGVTSNEMWLIHALIEPEQYEEEESGFKYLLGIGFDLTDNDIVQDVTHFYIGDEAFSEDTLEDFVNFASDFAFNYPVERSIKSLVNAGNKNVYQYVFSYDGGRNEKKNVGITVKGAAHGDELGYLLGASSAEPVAEEDQLIIDRITTLWSNFAKYGTPTPESSELLPVVLTPVTESTRPYIDIDSELQIRGRPFHDRLAFWDVFYKHYGEQALHLNDRK